LIESKFRAGHILTRARSSTRGLEIGHTGLLAELVIVSRCSESEFGPVQNTHNVVGFIWVVVAGSSAILVEGNAAVFGGRCNLVHLD
jgi:hypothetical protein